MHLHPAGIGHVINNAYGVQSAALCKAISAAGRRGRLDAFVQSTDKNFMVPVGGAIIAAPSSRPGLVEAVSKAYPGRAGMAPLLDLLITLLHWGAQVSFDWIVRDLDIVHAGDACGSLLLSWCTTKHVLQLRQLATCLAAAALLVASLHARGEHTSSSRASCIQWST